MLIESSSSVKDSSKLLSSISFATELPMLIALILKDPGIPTGKHRSVY